MATRSTWSRSVKKHKITWSEKEKRYIIKTPSNRRVYDTEYESDAVSWINRNVKK